MAKIPWNKNKLGWKKKVLYSFSVACLECGKSVLRYPSTLNKRTFCSVVCKSTNDSKNPLHGSWNIGVKRTQEQKQRQREIKLNLFASGKFIHPLLGKKRPEMSGEKNWNWNGGTSREYKTGYYSSEYKRWRNDVFKRDNYRCQDCGVGGTYLTAHHIKSFAHYPELRFVLSNGITLCEPCHSKTDNYRGRAKIQNMQLQTI